MTWSPRRKKLTSRKTDGGKGDKRRPQAVDSKTFEDNWELAFRQKQAHMGVDLATGADYTVERPMYVGLVTAEDRKPPEDTQ